MAEEVILSSAKEVDILKVFHRGAKVSCQGEKKKRKKSFPNVPLLTPILNIVLKQLEKLSSFSSFLLYILGLENCLDHKYLVSTP